MHYGDLLLSDLVPECVHSIHCYEPFAKCTVHIVKQQKVVTYLSPVKVVANGILIGKKIVCDCFIVLFWMPWSLYLQEFKVQIPKWARLSEIKNLLCSKSTNTLCYGTKCKSVAMSEMLCAKCWNIVLKNIEASYWIQPLCS